MGFSYLAPSFFLKAPCRSAKSPTFHCSLHSVLGTTGPGTVDSFPPPNLPFQRALCKKQQDAHGFPSGPIHTHVLPSLGNQWSHGRTQENQKFVSPAHITSQCAILHPVMTQEFYKQSPSEWASKCGVFNQPKGEIYGPFYSSLRGCAKWGSPSFVDFLLGNTT